MGYIINLLVTIVVLYILNKRVIISLLQLSYFIIINLSIQNSQILQNIYSVNSSFDIVLMKSLNFCKRDYV